MDSPRESAAPVEPEAAEIAPRLPLVTLAWIFLKIGATAVGDTGPVLAMIERELIEKRQVLTREDVTEALTYTKLLPGSTVVQIVAYLSYKLGGWPGSAIATTAYLMPSTLAMLVLATGYVAATVLPVLRPAVSGLTAAVVGILLATVYRLGKRNISVQHPLTIAIAVIAFVAGAFFGINAALLVVAGGLLGIPFLTDPSHQMGTDRGRNR